MKEEAHHGYAPNTHIRALPMTRNNGGELGEKVGKSRSEFATKHAWNGGSSPMQPLSLTPGPLDLRWWREVPGRIDDTEETSELEVAKERAEDLHRKIDRETRTIFG